VDGEHVDGLVEGAGVLRRGVVGQQEVVHGLLAGGRRGRSGPSWS
jgi:hypothetical protein